MNLDNDLTNFTVNNFDKDQFSLSEIMKILTKWIKFIRSKTISILVVGLLGSLFGYLYSTIIPIKYSAKLTFVVEENKNAGGGLAGLASIAGQFGVDVGIGSGGGLLSGDNILIYLKSSALTRSVLLTPVPSNENKTIADLYAESYNLKEKWKKNKKIGEVNFFPLLKEKVYSRVQDSLLLSMIDMIIDEQITVEKIDKKAGFIRVTAVMENEFLAKTYCELIVREAVKNYISVKIQRQKSNVEKLQIRVDSISRLLNTKTISSAELQASSRTMDLNPLYGSKTIVRTENTLRDKTILSTIFVSALQNLELAKFSLSQETPVIQIVDTPTVPLAKKKVSKILAIILSSFLFVSFYLVIIIIRKFIIESSQLNTN